MVRVLKASAFAAVALLCASLKHGAVEAQVRPLSEADAKMLTTQIEKCWRMPDGIESSSDLRILVRIDLDPDGRVIGQPWLVEPSEAAPPKGRSPFDAARRAILRCSAPGYDLPRETHDRWKTLDLEFRRDGVGLLW